MGEPRSGGRLQAARPGWGSLPRGTVGRGRPGPRFWRGQGHSLSWDPVPTPCTPRAPPSLATTSGSGVGWVCRLWLCGLTSLSPDAPPPTAASVGAGHAGSVFTSIAGARVTSRAIPEYLSPMPPIPPNKNQKIIKRNKNNEGTSRETGVLLLIMHVTLTVRPGPATPDTLPGSRRQQEEWSRRIFLN